MSRWKLTSPKRKRSNLTLANPKEYPSCVNFNDDNNAEYPENKYRSMDDCWTQGFCTIVQVVMFKLWFHERNSMRISRRLLIIKKQHESSFNRESSYFENPVYQNFLIPEIPKMCDSILVTLLKIQPHYSQSSWENATPSSGHIPISLL